MSRDFCVPFGLASYNANYTFVNVLQIKSSEQVRGLSWMAYSIGDSGCGIAVRRTCLKLQLQL